MNAWKAIFAALVIFGAGFATGAFSVKWVWPARAAWRVGANGPPGPWTARRRALIRRMDRELALSPVQRQHVGQIIDQSEKRLEALWAPIAPQARAEFHRCHQDIAAALSPTQRARFEAMFRRHGHQRQKAPALQSPDHHQPATQGPGP